MTINRQRGISVRAPVDPSPSYRESSDPPPELITTKCSLLPRKAAGPLVVDPFKRFQPLQVPLILRSSYCENELPAEGREPVAARLQ